MDQAPPGRAPSVRQHRDLNVESLPWIEHLPPVEFHQVEPLPVASIEIRMPSPGHGSSNPHQVEPLPVASIEI